jgi:aspartate oxidase
LTSGGVAAPEEERNLEDYVRETLDAGRGLNERRLVAQLATGAIEEVEFLRKLGVVLLPRPPLMYQVRAGNRSDKMPEGQALVKKLLGEVRRYDNTHLLSNAFIYELLVEGGQAKGAIGFKNGEPFLISSGSTVLATGGGGALYERNDNHKRMIGDGYALALTAGLSLVDMEFIQFYPFGFAEPGLPPTIIYPPYPDEVRVIDRDGNDFFKKHGIDMAVNRIGRTLRDKACHLIYKESQVGQVYMDYTHVPDCQWDQHPLTLFPTKRFNFREKPFQVCPLAHFFMGGIKADPMGRTDISGLFVAGEVAGGLHGANRRGGNALTECLVFGAKAGQKAALHAKDVEVEKCSVISEDWLSVILKGKDKSKSSSFRFSQGLKEVRELAWKSAGPLRSQQQMEQALSAIDLWFERLDQSPVSSFDEVVSKKELENALVVLKAIITSSLARKESRGALQRQDYPEEGGAEFTKRISVRKKEDNRNFEVSWEQV